ncbi:MAG: hypothetical protein HYR76_01530 [Ignavibacteria bacterium]|nr:hypothetical protein [Ignavibacteria bacterium]MBI3766360.1 hypothetical protein [Ignavibacteriales bacterium]
MSSVLDNVFSLVIGGIVVVLLSSLMLNMRSSSASQTLNTVVQSNMTSLTSVIEYDFRKIGYKVPVPPADSSIKYAGRDSIVVRGDADNDGTIDVVGYFIGKTKPANNINPRSRYLYRSVNGVTQAMNLGVTNFRLMYFDTSGIELTASPAVTNPSKIYSIKLAISMESAFPSQINKNDTVYSYTTWEQTMRPRNLRVAL